MTKTPQQIKNEVEKEIKRCNEIINNTKIDMKKDIWENKLLQHKAQLSILTEYDKSIKEMIEELKREILDLDRPEFINEDCYKRVLFKIDRIIEVIK